MNDSGSAPEVRLQIGMNGAMEMNCDLADQITIVDQLGYDYIEFRDWSVAEYVESRSMEELRSLLTTVKVKPLSVNAIMPITLGGGDDRRRLAESAERCLEIAAALSCPYVVACCFHGCEELEHEEGRRQVVDGVRLVSDMAALYGVTIAYEPLGNKDYPVHTVADTMRLLEEVDRGNVGWLLDAYHFHVVGDSFDALVASDIDRLCFVHICDAKDLPYEQLTTLTERVLPGDGVSDLPGLLAALHRTGYRGPFSIEMANQEFLAGAPRDFAAAAMHKARAVLDSYFR